MLRVDFRMPIRSSDGRITASGSQSGATNCGMGGSPSCTYSQYFRDHGHASSLPTNGVYSLTSARPKISPVSLHSARHMPDTGIRRRTLNKPKNTLLRVPCAVPQVTMLDYASRSIGHDAPLTNKKGPTHPRGCVPTTINTRADPQPLTLN